MSHWIPGVLHGGVRRRLVRVAGVALTTAPLALDPYTLSLVTVGLPVGLLAVSVAVLTGGAGLPSLGQVAPYAVGAYTTALAARAGLTAGPALLGVAIATAIVFSLVTGPVVRARGVVFLMATLAVGELTATAAGKWTSVTGGTDGLGAIPALRPFWGAAPMLTDRAVYWWVLAVTAAVVTALAGLRRTTAGLLLTGARDAETRMRASGHRVGAYLLAVHVLAGAVAGTAGCLLVVAQRYVSPADVGFEVSALVLLAVVIGGATSLPGVVAGAGLVLAVRDGLAAAWPGQAPLLLGALFLTVVYTAPRGLAGLASHTAGALAGHRSRLTRPVGRTTAPSQPEVPGFSSSEVVR